MVFILGVVLVYARYHTRDDNNVGVRMLEPRDYILSFQVILGHILRVSVGSKTSMSIQLDLCWGIIILYRFLFCLRTDAILKAPPIV